MLQIKIESTNKAYKLDITNEDKTVAKIIAEPLEKGFGQTIRIHYEEFCCHQFKVCSNCHPNTEFCMIFFNKRSERRCNRYCFKCKNLAIKSSSSNPKKIILDITGPKEVKAKDITHSRDEILNPDQTICNFDEKTQFHMELIQQWKRICSSPK